MKAIPQISVGDLLVLKKPHPCGSNQFKVARIGSDIKIICSSCEKALTLERIKVEKMIKNIIPTGEQNGN